MARNIEINYLTAFGYQALYPYTSMSNIVDWSSTGLNSTQQAEVQTLVANQSYTKFSQGYRTGTGTAPTTRGEVLFSIQLPFYPVAFFYFQEEFGQDGFSYTREAGSEVNCPSYSHWSIYWSKQYDPDMLIFSTGTGSYTYILYATITNLLMTVYFMQDLTGIRPSSAAFYMGNKASTYYGWLCFG